MSIVERIDQRLGLPLVLWTGVITADEWLAHIHQLIADTAWPPVRRLHISDIRSASLYRLQRKKFENMKVAIVAASSLGDHIQLTGYCLCLAEHRSQRSPIQVAAVTHSFRRWGVIKSMLASDGQKPARHFISSPTRRI